MSGLDELIARLEKATGPDRELDVAVFRTTVFNADQIPDKELHGPTAAVPRYTASIDAALTLYKSKPERVPTNPREACAEALRQWT